MAVDVVGVPVVLHGPVAASVKVLVIVVLLVHAVLRFLDLSDLVRLEGLGSCHDACGILT
jgi:hypothetical protein